MPDLVHHTNADREISIFPVQLTTSRIGNLTRLIHTLAICVTNSEYTLCFCPLLYPFFFKRNGKSLRRTLNLPPRITSHVKTHIYARFCQRNNQANTILSIAQYFFSVTVVVNTCIYVPFVFFNGVACRCHYCLSA